MLRPMFLVGMLVLLAGTGSASAASYSSRAASLLAKGEPRAAAIELRNAVKQDPANAAAHYELAKIDLSLGDSVGAEREVRAAKAHGYDAAKTLSLLLQAYLAQGRYKDLLHEFPSGNTNPRLAAEIAIGRGRAQLGLHRLDQATAEVATARRLAPNEVGPLLAEADLALAQHDLPAAERALAAAEAIDPHARPVLEHRATLLLATGKPQSALHVLQSLKTVAPGDPAVRLQLANALIAAGETAQAEAELKVALAMVPGSVEGIYLQALLAARDGDYHGAYELLQKLSPVIDRIPEAYLLEAVTLQHLGQWAAAESAANRFLGHFPNDPRGERVLATIALSTGKPKEALAALDALPPGERSDAESLDLLARAHATTGDLPAARTEFTKAAKLAPTLEAPHKGLAAVNLLEGNVLGAIDEYQKALILAPHDAAGRRELIAAEINAGQFEEAGTSLDILDKANPASVPDALLGAQLQVAQLDLPAANATYNRILKTHPDAAAAELGLAHVAALKGDTKAVRQHLDAILARDPANRTALALLTTLLSSQGKLEDARKLLEHAHSTSPNNLTITGDLAALELRMKRPENALDLLATANVADNPALLGLQAQAELAAGKKLAAADTLKSLLARAPNAVGARLALTRLLVADKNYDGARGVLEQGLAATPNDLALLRALVGVTLEEHGPAAALAEATRLAADASHAPAAHVLPGDFAMSQRNPAAAAKAYAAALAAAPSEALALRLSEALQAAGKPADAANSLRAYLAQHKGAIAILSALASLEISQGQLDQAAGRLESVVRADPTNSVALNNLAWILSKQGKPEALHLAERAYFLSHDPHMADTLGWIITQQKPSPTGLALLQAAHEASPQDPSVGYHLAAALAAAGKNSAAVSVLKPIVSGHKEFADKEAASALLHKLNPNP
ncbi:MAG: XrtA/PEP-CTERM system TPR-repeat protein PrsT [Acetobacteraceae bacterium]